MTTIYLTRHGQTEWNLEKRLQGRGNSPLTKFGIERAKELSERMKKIKIDKIYTSPIERAYKTAEILKGEKEIPLITEENLMEMNFGEFEGQIMEEIMAANPSWNMNFIMQGNTEMRAPKGETLQEVRDRVKIGMDKIILDNEGRNILIVAHGITLKALMYYFKDTEVNSEVMGQATLTKIIVDNNDIKIEFKNDGTHFTKENATTGW
ncbi:histidine phosphatase family protein [uncultured Clostridium sp.]|uniref:histidine phosphatase family protein n=1 Tax=uncultured Clostridium sp. TaxID=59620 RepID=UPI0026076086|nr:histidine phosphatase family protein [uncultured Clostridium sp.]